MPLIPPHGHLDRAGGRLLYRAVGLIFALIMLGTGFAAAAALRGGDYAAGGAFAAISAGLLCLVRWCFSAKRRLREAEWC